MYEWSYIYDIIHGMQVTVNTQRAIGLVLLIALWINGLILESSLFGNLVGFFYLTFFGYVFGNVLFPHKTKGWQFWWGMFLLQSTLILIGSIIYFIYNLAFPTPLIILTLSGLLIGYKQNKLL